ncbi:MAG: hypothetical protein MSA09_03500 [Lachnospiraceae bacterium]|nr:hypothetical protein [Lachnospiraceae bacterium]
MREAFKKIIEKLEEIRIKKTCKKEKCDTKELCRICVVDDAIEIVKQEAEKHEECYKDCGECEAYNKERHNDCVFNEGQDCPAAEGCGGYERKRTNFDMCCESMEAMAQIIEIAKIGWTKEQIMEWLQSEVEG